MTTTLADKIVGLIRAQGPISVAHYMQIALGDPFHGYYIARDPFGRDFVTAPEVSQMFGELLGLFFVQAWEDRGKPAAFTLAELGPGRGTLMADMLRAAAQVRPDFAGAARVVLVETSPLLRQTQERTLAPFRAHWVPRFSDVRGEEPLFVVANEFFDALPVHQFVRAGDGWHERMVIEQNGALALALAPAPAPAAILPPGLTGAPGAVFETCPAARAIAGEIGAEIAARGGAAVIVDYGHVRHGLGDTVQAMKAGAYTDPLAAPGEADITAHVDFAALAKAATEAGAYCPPVATQGAFLSALGIELRAERLKRSAPGKAGEIDAAHARLTGPGQMGTLFKVLAIAEAPGTLPGFPEAPC